MTHYKPNRLKDSRNRAVPNRAASQCSARKRSRFLIALLVSAVAIACTGCNFSRKPSKVVEDLVRTLERGETDKAVTFFSSRLINKLGIDALKQDLTRTTSQLKEHGGVKSIRILSEDETGETVQVRVEITRGNGNVTKARYTVLREAGAWKIDAVALDASELEPSRPDRAVDDVVNWAHTNGVASIKDWLQKQSRPPICNAPAVDRNTLPDEVRYHDVDDPKVKERLTSALEPVLKLVGCANSQGVVFYKGQNVYAGNLDGGLVAITPGALYFTGSPPDESIFHNLAELRIFLAREIFRQVIVVETPPEGLNQADMLLRHELKLNYLAGLVSLAIDKDPTILDRVALDIDLYGKRPGIPFGIQSAPDLRQIQNVFGAAKQDYKG